MTHGRFLIAEDHAFQRLALQQALQNHGATAVHGVANGNEAVRFMRQHVGEIDTVVVDLMMPDMDGIELLSALAEIAPGTPVILVSADAVMLDAAAAIARGRGLRVLGAVAKPLTPEKLRATLQAN